MKTKSYRIFVVLFILVFCGLFSAFTAFAQDDPCVMPYYISTCASNDAQCKAKEKRDRETAIAECRAKQNKPTPSSPAQNSSTQSSSQNNSENTVDPINTTLNNIDNTNRMLNSITNTIVGIMNNRTSERLARDRDAEEQKRVEVERVFDESKKEAEAAAARRRARAPEEESEEDERARERQRLYKQQREREKIAASVQTSDVCGWKGLQWFGDKDTVPTLEQFRNANGSAALSGDGAMVLKIRTITKDGNIIADINGSPVTGTINANRQIHLSGGDKQSTYYEVWGQFSTDGNVLTGKWRTEGYKVDISKPSRGIFALEAECKK